MTSLGKNIMNWDNVKQFAKWWMQNRPIRPPFKDCLFTTDLVQSLTLFREGNFQVELYLMKPDSQSPWHTHEGVDSVFVYLGGNLEFGNEDKVFNDTSEHQKEGDLGTHFLFGRAAEALNGGLHAVRTRDNGGAFLSFEHWKNGNPDSVVINWQGEHDGPIHVKTRQENLEAKHNDHIST